MTAWCAEKGSVAHRAALTLGAHYSLVLAAGPDPKLIHELRDQLIRVQTPAVLRYELARLLHQHRELDEGGYRNLLSATTPAPRGDTGLRRPRALADPRDGAGHGGPGPARAGRGPGPAARPAAAAGPQPPGRRGGAPPGHLGLPPRTRRRPTGPQPRRDGGV